MYFTLSQIQYIGLAILGGLIFIVVMAIAYWSHKLNLKAAEEHEAESVANADEGEEFPEGLREGHKPIPLVIMILIPALIIWGIAYTLAHAFGVFYAQ